MSNYYFTMLFLVVSLFKTPYLLNISLKEGILEFLLMCKFWVWKEQYFLDRSCQSKKYSSCSFYVVFHTLKLSRLRFISRMHISASYIYLKMSSVIVMLSFSGINFSFKKFTNFIFLVLDDSNDVSAPGMILG